MFVVVMFVSGLAEGCIACEREKPYFDLQVREFVCQEASTTCSRDYRQVSTCQPRSFNISPGSAPCDNVSNRERKSFLKI
jgi:hypothetical protein